MDRVSEGGRSNRLLVAKAASYLQEGLVSEAVLLLDGYLSRFPDDSRAHHLYGLALRAAGELVAAVDALRRALAADDPEAWVDLGVTLSLLEDHAEAVSAFAAAAALEPRSVPARLGLAFACRKLGRTDEGIRHLHELAAAAPEEPRVWHGLAAALLDASDLAAAERAARRFVALAPNEPAAPGLLGAVLLRRGEFTGARRALELAVAGAPEDFTFRHNLIIAQRDAGDLDAAIEEARGLAAARPGAPAQDALGICLRLAGRLEEAAAVHGEAMALAPDDAVILHNAALVSSEQGRTDEALEILGRALGHAPDDAEILNSYGNNLRIAGRLEEAQTTLERVIALAPRSYLAHYNLAMVLTGRGRRAEAVGNFERALGLRPGVAVLHNSLANVLVDMLRLDEAIHHYETAVRIDPRFAGAWANLGYAYFRCRRLAEAEFAYDRAIEADPRFAPALYGLSIVHRQRLEFERAVTLLRHAAEWAPDDPMVNNNLGVLAAADLGLLDEGLAAFRRAIAGAGPDEAARFHSNMLFCLNYDDRQDARSLAAAHREWDSRYGCHRTDPTHPHRHDRDAGRRLRIGFVSPDFRRHAVSNFFLPLIQARDPSRVEMICYASVERPDAISERIKAAADAWVDAAGLDDQELLERIRGDGVDILIDLAGHTADNRLAVFARKPAPVQAAWLGYPGALGLSAIDWRISDAVTDPPGEADRLGLERILRLEGGFHCYRPFDETPAVAALPALRNGHITFGSFNAMPKISPTAIALWSQVLQRVPGSQLLLKTKQLAGEESRARIMAAFSRHDVADRVAIAGFEPEESDHLAIYGRVDIALDTFPYHGTTTSCEAMWMGVPVVSLCGDSHVSRVGASLATTLGLEFLIAESRDAFVEIAARLASDLDSLAMLRAGLRATMLGSPLCDAPGFARRFEDALRGMWAAWCAGPATCERVKG